MNKEKLFIYDIEIYPNLFFLSALNPFTNVRRRFQISPLADERQSLAKWLLEEVEHMVGFNNLFFDYPVLHYIITKLMNVRGKDAAFKAFQYGDNLIKGKKNPYLNTSNPLRKQIDLYKINHFDNKAKMTSLKLLQFNMRMQNIEELPYEPGTYLEKEQIFKVISYCDNDVDATAKLFFKSIPAIELRQALSPKYNIDFTNFNDVKIGEQIFISKIINRGKKHLIYEEYEDHNGNIKKKVLNTKRDQIVIKDILLSFIKFRTTPFKKIHEWFSSKIIKDINGVFSKIPFEEMESLVPYYNVIKTKQRQKTLNIVYQDFQYDFGTGGIHGSIKAGVYVPAPDELIVDIDVEGYYPSEAIVYKFEPGHLKGVYSDVHEEIKNERGQYPKKTSENTSMKLAGNGSYGNGGNEFSPLCDKQYVAQTCINGQLLLCMLAETLGIELSYSKMLQINTDGMTLIIKKDELELFRTICGRWQNLTKLKLEEAFYSKMVISNVNNYLAIYTDGKVKRKGLYEYNLEDTLHKDFSMLIVPKALEAYFVNGESVETFVQNHNDMYDFLKRTKVNKVDKLFIKDYCVNTNNLLFEKEIQRVTRYLVTGAVKYDPINKFTYKEGFGISLIKEMPPVQPDSNAGLKKITSLRKLVEKGKLTEEELDNQLRIHFNSPRYTNFEADYLCTEMNKLPSDSQIKSSIYYPYYINEIYKVINSIEKNG